MKKSAERIAAVVGAAALLAVGVDALSVAATGNGLILGRVNSANKTTTIKNTGSGAPLNLVTKKSTQAPFTTNARGQVKNLNASQVGGLSAAQLRGHWAAVSSTGAVSQSSGGVSVTNPIPGTYCVTVAGVDPSKTVAVVSPDYAHDSTNTGLGVRWAVVEPRTGQDANCAGNTFEVRSFDAVVNGATETLTPAADPFMFVTPQ